MINNDIRKRRLLATARTLEKIAYYKNLYNNTSVEEQNHLLSGADSMRKKS